MPRSPLSRLEVLIALIGGFFASFLAFATLTVQNTDYFQAQLMAGDPAANRTLPTTLHTLQGAMDGTDPLIAAMGSYAWWILVMIGALVAAFIILKLMRRYA